MGTPRDTLYPWGKGINKQKTNKQIKCVCLVKSAVYDVGQQGSSTAKRKCLHCEASVQCDRGTEAHGVCKGGETALFEPDVVFRHIKKAQHIMLRVF